MEFFTIVVVVQQQSIFKNSYKQFLQNGYPDHLRAFWNPRKSFHNTKSTQMLGDTLEAL